MSAGIRLQKFLSDAGVSSRRHAEELILNGRVLVNDRVVDSLPAFVDPSHDVVIVDGQRVRVQQHAYYIVHKPRGFITTHSDPAGRPRVIDLLPPLKMRVFPVGRLDADSSGLLVLTNDGELSQQLTHPTFGVPKVYRVEVRGLVTAEGIQRMRDGVYFAEGKAQASEVRLVHAARDLSHLEITLREGRNRQVRRMLARLGHPVRKLKRIQFGPLSLRGLPVGAVRALSAAEIEQLRAAVSEGRAAARPVRRERRRSVAPAPERAGKRAVTIASRGGKSGERGQSEQQRRTRRIIT